MFAHVCTRSDMHTYTDAVLLMASRVRGLCLLACARAVALYALLVCVNTGCCVVFGARVIVLACVCASNRAMCVCVVCVCIIRDR